MTHLPGWKSQQKRLELYCPMIWILIIINNPVYFCAVVRSALHYAAGHVRYHCVKSLVLSGSSVNQADTKGCTPLHYAAAGDVDAK